MFISAPLGHNAQSTGPMICLTVKVYMIINYGGILYIDSMVCSAGYGDLEFGLMMHMKAIGPDTVVVTTVHDCQVSQTL